MTAVWQLSHGDLFTSSIHYIPLSSFGSQQPTFLHNTIKKQVHRYQQDGPAGHGPSQEAWRARPEDPCGVRKKWPLEVVLWLHLYTVVLALRSTRCNHFYNGLVLLLNLKQVNLKKTEFKSVFCDYMSHVTAPKLYRLERFFFQVTSLTCVGLHTDPQLWSHRMPWSLSKPQLLGLPWDLR